MRLGNKILKKEAIPLTEIVLAETLTANKAKAGILVVEGYGRPIKVDYETATLLDKLYDGTEIELTKAQKPLLADAKEAGIVMIEGDVYGRGARYREAGLECVDKDGSMWTFFDRIYADELHQCKR